MRWATALSIVIATVFCRDIKATPFEQKPCSNGVRIKSCVRSGFTEQERKAIGVTGD